jgi:hypothetical protein
VYSKSGGGTIYIRHSDVVLAAFIVLMAGGTEYGDVSRMANLSKPGTLCTRLADGTSYILVLRPECQADDLGLVMALEKR